MDEMGAGLNGDSVANKAELVSHFTYRSVRTVGSQQAIKLGVTPDGTVALRVVGAVEPERFDPWLDGHGVTLK